MNILLRSALFLALLLLFGCGGDDDPVIPPPQPNCTITPSGLNYGQVDLGKTLDMSFTITNSGTDTLLGLVSEACPDFNIQSGDGAYALAPTESRMVTVTFAPTVTGTRNCIVGTGNSECGDVSLTGEGVPLSKTLVSSLDNTLYQDALGGISNGIGQWMFVGVTKGTPSPGGNPDPPEIR
ncbi:MAG: choice-of-anchor D domain-containing protein, partial [bacterium]|nr:choice-of-anchor D domain-containing protein [bacterium]